ncbi:MAG: DMT family transporter [Pseudomonadota bacterium]
MEAPSKAGLLDYGLLATLAAIFGASFMMTKVAVADVPPGTIAFARIVVAAAIIFVAMLMMRQTMSSLKGHWRMVFLAGLFGNALPFFLISWGQEEVDAGLTAILMAVMPLFTLFLAHFFTADEKLNIYRIIGFVLGLVGVAILIGIDKLASFGGSILREYAIMAAACCYGVHAILSKFIVQLPRYAVSAGVLIASTIWLLPIVLYLDQPWNLNPSGLSWLMIILLGIFPTALGTLMLFMLVGRQGAGFLSQINFLVPVFGVLWAILFLGEVLPANAVLALVIILIGIAIARIKSPSKPAERLS